jgi:peptidoglycan biosynthesis protein MviN/MurJ (putative lipid II flippase)
VIGVLFQLIGLLFMILVAKKFGANAKIDAYYYIIAIHFFLITVIQNVFKIILLPILIFEKNNNPQQIDLLFNNLIIVSSIFSLSLTLLVIGFANLEIFKSFFPSNLSIEYYRSILYLSSPLIFLNVLSSILSNMYNSYQKFGILEALFNSRIFISFLFFYLFSDYLQINSLILGNVIGQFIVLFISIYYLKSIKILNFKFEFRFHKSLIGISKVSIIPLISTVLVAFQPLVINYFLTKTNVLGSISLFNYSQKIASIPTIIFSAGMLTVFVSHVSNLEVKGYAAEIKNTTTKSVSFLITLILPLIIFISFARFEIVSILFNKSNLTSGQLLEISNTTVLLLLSLGFLQIHSILSRIFIVKQNTRILFFLSIGSFIIQVSSIYVFVIILNFLTYGVSFSLITTNAIILSLSIWYNIAKYNSIEINYIFKNFIKTIPAIFILLIIYFFGNNISNIIQNVFVTLFFKLFIIVFIYFSSLFYFKHSDILLLFSYFKKSRNAQLF